MRIGEKIIYLYIGFVALSLNHKTRKTSAWENKYRNSKNRNRQIQKCKYKFPNTHTNTKNRNTQIHKHTNAITNTKIEIQKKLPSQRWNGHRRATRLSSPAGWSRARSELKNIFFYTVLSSYCHLSSSYCHHIVIILSSYCHVRDRH